MRRIGLALFVVERLAMIAAVTLGVMLWRRRNEDRGIGEL
jgi:hypothetical protein